MIHLLDAVEAALGVLFWLVFIQALLSWIPSLMGSSGALAGLERAMRRVTEPLLSPIREHMPGGMMVDFSPMVLLLLISVVRWLLARLVV